MDTTQSKAGPDKFRRFWRNLKPERKKALAAACQTKPIWLTQIAGGHGQASPKLARALEAATFGKITAADMRPDVFE